MIFLIRLIDNVAYIYSLFLVVYALLSWFPGAYDSPLGRWLEKMVSPYLKVFIPLNLRIGMIDLTVLAAILVLNVGKDVLIRLLLLLL